QGSFVGSPVASADASRHRALPFTSTCSLLIVAAAPAVAAPAAAAAEVEAGEAAAAAPVLLRLAAAQALDRAGRAIADGGDRIVQQRRDLLDRRLVAGATDRVERAEPDLVARVREERQ